MSKQMDKETAVRCFLHYYQPSIALVKAKFATSQCNNCGLSFQPDFRFETEDYIMESSWQGGEEWIGYTFVMYSICPHCNEENRYETWRLGHETLLRTFRMAAKQMRHSRNAFIEWTRSLRE